MATYERQSWPGGRRVAIVNWRDSGHPQAGGAETYCLTVARWLAGQGAEVTLVTSRAPGQARRSVEDGVAIHRGGGRFGVYLYALAWLLARRPIRLIGRRGQIDAVLDCQNGIPFFAPLAVGRRVPVALLIHHVHQDQFELHFGQRLAGIGRFLEGRASRFIYRRRPVIAVSPSTRMEIRRRLRFRNPIFVVPNGGPRPTFAVRERTAHPSVVSVGRLVVQKQVDQLLEAVAEASAQVPGLVLHLIGIGEERENLERQAIELELGDAVIFHGRVSDAERDAILNQSWIFLSASQREGWGVSVLEAAAHGVPALVRDVPGLRDAVRDGSTGWLLAPDTSFSAALVDAVEALTDAAAAQASAQRCYAWAQNFSWTRSARRVSEILEHEWRRTRAHQPVRRQPDLVTRVELDLSRGSEQRIGSLLRASRLTDEWRWTPGRLVGLLYGTDEQGAQRALTRLGVNAGASLGVARSHDLLGDVPPPVAAVPSAEGGDVLAPPTAAQEPETAGTGPASASALTPTDTTLALTEVAALAQPAVPLTPAQPAASGADLPAAGERLTATTPNENR